MRKYELMNMVEVNTEFEEFVFGYMNDMTCELESNEDVRDIVNNWDGYFWSNTNLVYSWRCKEVFQQHFEEILEICEEYKIECCTRVSHEIDEMVMVAFDYKINQFLSDVEYFIQYEMEDEEEDEE